MIILELTRISFPPLNGPPLQYPPSPPTLIIPKPIHREHNHRPPTPSEPPRNLPILQRHQQLPLQLPPLTPSPPCGLEEESSSLLMA